MYSTKSSLPSLFSSYFSNKGFAFSVGIMSLTRFSNCSNVRSRLDEATSGQIGIVAIEGLFAADHSLLVHSDLKSSMVIFL
jgi:hypothetical protein